MKFNIITYSLIGKNKANHQVSELFGLKDVLLTRIMEDNTNRMFKKGTSLSDHLNEFQAPNGVVSLQMVKGSVLNKEMRRKAQGPSSQSEENRGKKDKLKEKDDDHDHDHDRATTATGDDLVILRDFESVNFVSDESMWIIDSGATLHVTPRKEFFTSYIADDFGVLKMGNDVVTKVIGVGDIFLQTNTGMQLWLRGVKHALNVHFNLIFVHMLDDGGYENHFVHGKWKLTKKLEKCSHCMAGKQTKVSFKKNPPSRKSELLELVHSDVCDPLKETPGLCFEDKGPIALNTEVPNKIWFGKDVKMYDPIEKKLVRSRDVQFMEDQTIEDIDKVKKSTPKKDNSLSEIDPVRMLLLGDGFDISLNDDAEEEQKMSQDENLGDSSEPPPVQLKKSNRQRQSSIRYTSDEYVTLTDGEEPECYQESMESEERQKTWQSKL
ncbi:hypothetical protein CR513_26867, partial [Mucuna pruriens]